MPRATETEAAERASGLASRFDHHLARTDILSPDSRLLIAISGGVDSTTLLHLLRFRTPTFELVAAHFDHRMRDGSADDAAWVRGLCRAWCVPLESGTARVALRTEAEARTARYAFLHATAERVGATRILTAHNADDQAETVVFRLLRGSGGLYGIPERRGAIVRPLLWARRHEIETYATRWGLSWRSDPTNALRDRARNRIRHTVLPAMERAMPGATDRLVALARREREAESAWAEVIDGVLEEVVMERTDARIQLARTPLLGYHRHIRGRVIRKLFGELGCAPGRAGTRAAMSFVRSGASGTGIELSGGLRLERHFDRLSIVAPIEQPGADTVLTILSPEAGEGKASIGGVPCRVVWSDRSTGNAPLTAAFDPTALRFPLELRAWRAGDRIRLTGGTRKLKKLFGDRRIPRYERGRVPVLADSEGRILWVAGLARAARTEPEAGARVFHIQVFDGIDG